MPKTNRYFSDDARIKAVETSLDINKPWGKQTEDAKQNALKSWHKICKNWYEDNKEYADSPKGIESALRDLKLALMHIRRKRFY
jgi:hypothetical protein